MALILLAVTEIIHSSMVTKDQILTWRMKRVVGGAQET